MSGRLDSFGEAQQITRRPAQRRFGDEGSAALPARDQALANKLLDGTSHREAAHGEFLRQLRFAG